MKGLKTLIKLSKRALDELRREMVSLESQKAQLALASQRMGEELAREMEAAGKQPQMAHFFGNFAKRIRESQERIAGEIRVLDKQMALLGDKIADAYGELKKYEIALENHKKREREEQKRKDTIALDEVAGVQHERKKKS